MKTNYVWKTSRDKKNVGDLYAGATNNPGFETGQRWAHYARKTPYGQTYASDIHVVRQWESGYAHETVSKNEQIEINTIRKVAFDLRSVGMKCQCLNVQNPNKDYLGIIDKELYKDILKEYYPEGWKKIKKLRSKTK